MPKGVVPSVSGTSLLNFKLGGGGAFFFLVVFGPFVVGCFSFKFILSNFRKFVISL